MKFSVIACAVSIVFGTSAFAQTSTPASTPTSKSTAVEQLTKTDKKSRKKKVLMCAECGKPESECECEGHHGKGEHKDDHSKEASEKK
ncbi:MAG: hypothetical protein JNJ49_13465 [Bdellovibrionaceae bacterium]|nr:hypothetical protein [Pseudobdellovibrionaceae bacterium]